MENLDAVNRAYAFTQTNRVAKKTKKNRRGLKCFAFAVAAVLFFGVAVQRMPRYLNAAAMLSIPSIGASAANVSAASLQNIFIADDSLLTLKLSAVEEKNQLIRQVLREEASAAFTKDNSFSAYITVLSAEEAKARIAAYKAKLAAQKAAEEAAAAWNEKARSAAAQRGYVRLNWNGVPMSEKTMPDWLQLDENGIPTHYKQLITGNATAYYGDGITATGTVPVQGSVAVDPRKIPYGTKMWITSADGKIVYGYAVAEDTGGFIYYRNGATVDLFMQEYDDCVKWGWRQANIYILE